MRQAVVLHLGCVLVALSVFTASIAEASLISVNWDTGQLYEVSTTDASFTPLANLGMTGLSDLAVAPDGTIYALRCTLDVPATTASLYTIDIGAGTATLVRVFDQVVSETGLPISNFVYEGGLAIAPGGGIAYASNFGDSTNPALFQIDLSTFEARRLFPLSGAHDLNGMIVRSDGKIIALDRKQDALILIDPATETWNVWKTIGDPAGVGSVGGLTIQNGVGYFVTGAPPSTDPGSGKVGGSNKLYSFDLATGDITPIGSLPVWADENAFGIAGLIAPEPAAVALLAMGMFILKPLRRRG